MECAFKVLRKTRNKLSYRRDNLDPHLSLDSRFRWKGLSDLSEGPMDHGKHCTTEHRTLVYGANKYDLSYAAESLHAQTGLGPRGGNPRIPGRNKGTISS